MKLTAGRTVLYTFPERESAPNNTRTVPAVVVAPWSDDCANLRIFTDGPTADTIEWRTSVNRAEEPGVPDTWAWPPRVEQ